MKNNSFIICLVICAALTCAFVAIAARDVTNSVSLTGTTFVRTAGSATIVPNLFSTSGAYDKVTLYVEGAYVFTNSGTKITVPAKSTKEYNLLALLNYNTNVWTNVIETLFYQPVP